MSLLFSGRRVTYIPCFILATRPEPDMVMPRVAYLDFSELGARRARKLDEQVGARRCWRYNPPCKALMRYWLRRLTPQDPLRDPYIAALLIAMAQAQRATLGHVRDGTSKWPVCSPILMP